MLTISGNGPFDFNWLFQNLGSTSGSIDLSNAATGSDLTIGFSGLGTGATVDLSNLFGSTGINLMANFSATGGTLNYSSPFGNGVVTFSFAGS